MGRLGTYTDATVPMITDPQLKFLTSLTRELFALTRTITGEEYPGQAEAIEHLSTLTKRTASDRIGSLKNEILPTMRQTAKYRAQTVERPDSAPAPVEIDTDGIYIVDGEYYRVQRSGAGRLYAKRLDTESRRWEYAPGAVKGITPDHRITAAEAAALPFSWCIRCGADLTADDSVARRMGPICYGKSVG